MLSALGCASASRIFRLCVAANPRLGLRADLGFGVNPKNLLLGPSQAQAKRTFLSSKSFSAIPCSREFSSEFFR
jgi:hypothetical protein